MAVSEKIRALVSSDAAMELHYGGRFRAPSSQRRIDVVSPATLSPVTAVSDADETDVERAVAAAAEAFPAWSAMDALDRARHLRAFADVIGDHIADLAWLETAVTGRPIREMKAQMGRIPEWLEYFSGIAAGLEAEANRVKGNFVTLTQYDPLGPVALLTPWNHPVLILIKKLAAALAAGNCCVIKPSELAPVSPLIVAELAAIAGMPEGTVNVVTGGATTGELLCRAEQIRYIDLTGGTATGRKVAGLAGERLVRSTMELGGKTPVIVCEDADLPAAVAGALFSAFVASGQTCVAGSRFLVHRSIHDAFVDEFARRADAIRLGDPFDEETQMGPVISRAALERCRGMIATALSEGARRVAGVSEPPLAGALADGFFVRPTVFTGVEPRHRLFNEEVFGPVVSVTPFADEEEALTLANHGPFGLGVSIWTRDVGRAHRLAGKVRGGVIWVNDHHKNDPRSVWGGVGDSGFGKENGWDALKNYVTKRSIVIRTEPGHDDWFDGGSRYG